MGLSRHREMRAGVQVLPEFTVVQHQRDVQVLHALKAYFGCGVVRRNNGDRMAYRVRGHEHLSKNIVPFFEKHLLKSRKRVDFIKFREIVNLMSRGEHLTRDGVEKIRAIAQEMNRKGLKIKSDCSGNGVE